ncbi:tRNA (adenosine(37)-N6)-dimethylallyltransferase MiaA [Mycoplasmoides alvi]|uniref:tRNA (adenosine(37)-N6)-dimethylallyltransferase MiaA n=1 Tax=Mycoplasmoides alvi TaxID=78580 RepID=UPI00051BAF42|nr:tRNA (adenosine(37)-N6)-dimethylallyltransferase MiaA [Mycoplasmoides alvi]
MSKKIIAIIGPTGSKKSHVAIEIAKYLNFRAEIISVDSFQVYKEISIGINKPNLNDLKLVKHHLINYISVKNTWDIKQFKDLSEKIIDNLFDKKLIPILCGGSNLYMDALINNYDLSKSPKRNPDLYKNLTNEELHAKLHSIDPIEALKIGKFNRKRLERALEIYETTGIQKSVLIKNNKPKYNVLYIFCNLKNKDELMTKLNERTIEMYNNGWLNEIKDLIKKWPEFINSQASKAIGYSYLIDCIINNKNIELSILQKLIRQLAKRQITWCKNHYLENKINFDFYHDNIYDLFKKINEFLKN